MERVYQVEAGIEIDEERYERKKMKLGRFVLATKDLTMKAEEILTTYKKRESIVNSSEEQEESRSDPTEYMEKKAL